MADETAPTEPVVIGGLVAGVGTAILALLTGTEVVDPEVAGLLGGVMVAVIALVTGLVRSKVTPV